MEETPDGVAFAVTLTLGPLTLTDRFHLTGSLVERTVRVAAPADAATRRQLHGLRMTLPGAGIGPPAECRFEAPACAVRPRLPLTVAARQSPQRPGDDPHFAPGARSRWQTAINDCPDVTPGLMVVHNPRRSQSLLAWYVSRVEAATALVGGDGQFPDLIHQPALAAWLSPGASVTGGTQYILLHEGDYPAALDAYRALYPRTGIEPPLYGEPPAWTRHAAIYEVHPGQFGGFRGLTARIPALARMGITVLYLMPVMEFDNRHRAAGRPDQPWDENWLGGGSPYAIRDFEALEPSLGTEADFRQLVQTAHAHGMRVLLDFVPQGCALDARYVTEHPDWFCRDEAGNMVHSHGWVDTWSFDWANADYQAYMLDWSLRRVREWDVDGYRVDAPHGKEPNWAAGLPYHASATNLGVVRLLERLREGLRAVKPDAVLLCELFGPLFARSHDLLYDYYPMVMGYELLDGRLTPREFGEWLSDYWRVMPAVPQRVCFTETHDTRSHHPPAYKLRGSLAERALFGILIAAGFVPMIWAGQERGLEDFYRGMLAARRRSRALREGERLCNAVSCRETIAERDYRAHEHVFSLLRRTPDETVWAMVSLYPEVTPFTFSLPLERLGLRPEARYRLRDLATGEVFREYGRGEWRGAELANITLTPRMFRPYLWRVERVTRM
ncbi:MAG: hypothetical protein D6796_17025 [Caldilineae bacterium]|nr:MAG: hypothetical protein D6796_17025 [Caldilineae bacterium]